MTDYDAIVVGGGIVGASTAYHLARDGERVALFDRADEGRATDVGAGIVAPVSSDSRPIIGNAPGVTGAFVATGHGSTGLHLGPYTGLVVSELVRGRESPVDIESFSPERFTES